MYFSHISPTIFQISYILLSQQQKRRAAFMQRSFLFKFRNTVSLTQAEYLSDVHYSTYSRDLTLGGAVVFPTTLVCALSMTLAIAINLKM